MSFCLVLPDIMGVVDHGETLSLSDGTWSDNPVGFKHVWCRDGVPIPGAEDATYMVAAGDIGRVITARVTAIFADETRMTVTTTPAA
jgi:hypothetical protein